MPRVHLSDGPGAWIFRQKIFGGTAEAAPLRMFAAVCYKKQPEHLPRLCMLTS